MLQTTSSNVLVTVHAVRQADGSINVMVINKDPSVRYNVSVSLTGASSHGWADRLSLRHEQRVDHKDPHAGARLDLRCHGGSVLADDGQAPVTPPARGPSTRKPRSPRNGRPGFLLFGAQGLGISDRLAVSSRVRRAQRAVA